MVKQACSRLKFGQILTKFGQILLKFAKFARSGLPEPYLANLVNLINLLNLVNWHPREVRLCAK